MKRLIQNNHFNTTNYNPSVLRINSHSEKYIDELFVEIILDNMDDSRLEGFIVYNEEEAFDDDFKDIVHTTNIV